MKVDIVVERTGETINTYFPLIQNTLVEKTESGVEVKLTRIHEKDKTTVVGTCFDCTFSGQEVSNSTEHIKIVFPDERSYLHP